MSTKIFGDGDHDASTLAQIHRCVAVSGARGVLCADGHKGYAQPIGGVVAYKDLISISGVGFDIACGKPRDPHRRHGRGDRAEDGKNHGRHRPRHFLRRRAARTRRQLDHELFDDPTWGHRAVQGPESARALRSSAPSASGNHYVDIFADEADRVWVGVHFGSRGLGHKTATIFLKKADGKDGMDVAPTVVRQESQLGQDYLAGMKLAGRYAYAGREYVARHVVKKILWAKIEKRCTTTTTSPGRRSTAPRPTGSCAKARHRHSRVRKVSWAAAWATTP